MTGGERGKEAGRKKVREGGWKEMREINADKGRR